MPIIDAVKGWFGISSPSTVMAEIGGDLIAGLKQGIINAWTGISNWFQTTIFNPLKAWFNGAWENIKTGATNAWSNIKLVWNTVVGWFQTTIVAPLKEKFNTFWTDIKQIFTDLWEDIKVIWDVVSWVVPNYNYRSSKDQIRHYVDGCEADIHKSLDRHKGNLGWCL